MLKKDILDVHFRASDKGHFEVITLQGLFRRKLNHLITDAHRLHFNIILIFTKGKGFHYIDFKKYEYLKNDLLFVVSGQVQRFEMNKQGEALMLMFTDDFICNTDSDYKMLSQSQIFNTLTSAKIQLDRNSFSDFYQLATLLESEFKNEKSWINTEIIRNQLRIFLLKAERIKLKQYPFSIDNPHQRMFVQFKTLLDKEYATSRNSDYYADKLAVSTKKLNYIVQSITQKTTKLFIDERVVLEIKRFLTNSELSIKEVAYHTGFDEPTNLVKYFRKHTDQTPTEFKLSLKN